MGNYRGPYNNRHNIMIKTSHGGNIKEIKLKYPDVIKPWIDLSTGLNPNPYPWQEKIPKKLILEASHLLPQNEDDQKCKEAWLDYLSASYIENWLLIPGSQAYINILPTLFPNHHALIPTPNYNEHERVWHCSKNSLKKISREALKNYDFERRTLLILTNPNNPDGYNWSKNYLIELANVLKKKDGILVVDEAFSDVKPDHSLATLPNLENVIILRSFGKFFGLGGVRLGMVKVTADTKDKTISQIGPWAVNGLALKIALNAFKDKKWIRDTKQKIKADMNVLKEIIVQAGFNIIGSTDLFCLAENENARDINIKLNKEGIAVRVFNECPTQLRFGLFKNKEEAIRLKEALND